MDQLATHIRQEEGIPFEIRLWCHCLGMNIVPLIQGTKRPKEAWREWQHKAQTWSDLEGSGWDWSGGVAAINGVGGWHSLDIDEAVSSTILGVILNLLDLPQEYPWVVQSRRGYHLWFRCAEEDLLLGPKKKGCFVGSPLEGGKFKQLEVRWSENITVLPPSVHPSGYAYSWAHGHPGWDTSGCWLSARRLEQALPLIARFGQEQEQAPQHVLPPKPVLAENRPHWAQSVFEGVLASLVQAQNGNRNRKLNWAAYMLGQLVGSGYLGEDRVAQELSTIASTLGLDEGERLRTINSGIAAGKKSPRHPD